MRAGCLSVANATVFLYIPLANMDFADLSISLVLWGWKFGFCESSTRGKEESFHRALLLWNCCQCIMTRFFPHCPKIPQLHMLKAIFDQGFSFFVYNLLMFYTAEFPEFF